MTALAICLRMVVLPVRGGATIKPRVPLPIGVTRSMMRVSIRSGVVSRLNFSIGSIVVRFSKRDGLGVILERHLVDLVHRLELGAVAAVRRLGWACDQAAFAQEIALDRVGRDEDSVGLGWKWFSAVRRKPNPFSEISR